VVSWPSDFPTKSLYTSHLYSLVLHAPPISFFSIQLNKFVTNYYITFICDCSREVLYRRGDNLTPRATQLESRMFSICISYCLSVVGRGNKICNTVCKTQVAGVLEHCCRYGGWSFHMYSRTCGERGASPKECKQGQYERGIAF
jgi:hypothetical protein